MKTTNNITEYGNYKNKTILQKLSNIIKLYKKRKAQTSHVFVCSARESYSLTKSENSWDLNWKIQIIILVLTAQVFKSSLADGFDSQKQMQN